MAEIQVLLKGSRKTDMSLMFRRVTFDPPHGS